MDCCREAWAFWIVVVVWTFWLLASVAVVAVCEVADGEELLLPPIPDMAPARKEAAA